MNTLRALLTGAIDYAGLFPPAALDMETATRNYDSYRTGEHAWLLGRFIVPVARLGEFERALPKTTSQGDRWLISALVGADIDHDVATIFGFNKRQHAIIDTVEIKASTIDGVKAVARSVPSLLTTYVEIPLDCNPAPLIVAIHASGLRAKVRTGGVTPDAFPSSHDLAGFIHACVAARTPFKATAGLHHALRATYRLTYEPGTPSGTMYGFLNVFIASGVAYSGGTIRDVAAVLEEQSVLAFHLKDGEIGWGKYLIDITKIATLRSEIAVSFGSCSFTEPIDDLNSLRLL